MRRRSRRRRPSPPGRSLVVCVARIPQSTAVAGGASTSAPHIRSSPFATITASRQPTTAPPSESYPLGPSRSRLPSTKRGDGRRSFERARSRHCVLVFLSSGRPQDRRRYRPREAPKGSRGHQVPSFGSVINTPNPTGSIHSTHLITPQLDIGGHSTAPPVSHHHAATRLSPPHSSSCPPSLSPA